MVIDDMGDMRTTLRRMLADLGAERITMASTAEDGLAMLERQSFHVVLCDYNLGEGKDGQQLLEEARHRRLLAISTTWLMVTAESSVPMVLGALEYQPDDYLVKPFASDVLLARLQRAIERKRALSPLDRAVADGDLHTAVALCDTLRPSDDPRRRMELLRLKAELLLTLEKPQHAAQLFEAALEQRPYAWARFGLARALTKMDRGEEGRQLLEALLFDQPRLPEAYDALANIHEAAGRLELAQQQLDKATALSPKSVRRHRRLAALSILNGDFETATRAYRAAINNGRGSCFSGAKEYAGLASVLHQQRDTARATAVLRDGRKQFRGRPLESVGLIVAQINLYRSIGQEAEVDKLIHEALKLDERYPDQLDNETTLDLARCCLRAANWHEEGIQLLAALVRNRHDEPVVLAAVQAMCDEFDLTEAERLRIEFGRQEMVELNNDGVSLFRQGNLAAAAELFQRAAERLPQNRTVTLNAAKVMLQLMRTSGAEPDKLEAVRKLLDRLRGQPDPTGGYAQSMRMYRSLAGRDRSEQLDQLEAVNG